MNMRAEFYCSTAEEIELVLEFARKIEALRAARYPQASNPLHAGLAVANAVAQKASSI